jgi:hypothetical protein
MSSPSEQNPAQGQPNGSENEDDPQVVHGRAHQCAYYPVVGEQDAKSYKQDDCQCDPRHAAKNQPSDKKQSPD